MGGGMAFRMGMSTNKKGDTRRTRFQARNQMQQVRRGRKGGNHRTGILSAVHYYTAEARARGEVTLQGGVVRDRAMLVVRLERGHAAGHAAGEK